MQHQDRARAGVAALLHDGELPRLAGVHLASVRRRAVEEGREPCGHLFEVRRQRCTKLQAAQLGRLGPTLRVHEVVLEQPRGGHVQPVVAPLHACDAVQGLEELLAREDAAHVVHGVVDRVIWAPHHSASRREGAGKVDCAAQVCGVA
eukprot:5632104-Prymnesium_polylepis.1